jgi:hypothetical protein
MNRRKKEKGDARRIWGIVLLVIGLSGLFSTLIILKRVGSQTDHSAPLRLFITFIITLIGIFLVRSRADTDPYRKWAEKDPSKADGLIRKIGRIKNDQRLLEIGEKAGLENVAREAFARISDQSLLCDYVSHNIGSSKRLETALSCMTDNMMLASVVNTDRYLSADLRKKAVDQMTDTGCLLSLAGNLKKSISTDVRREIYNRLLVLTKEQGGDSAGIDLMITKDPELLPDYRKQAYQRLQSAGRDGYRLMAEDESMPLRMRSDACERIEDQEIAADLRLKIDQEVLLNDGSLPKNRKAAGRRILENGDPALVENMVRTALQGDNNTDGTLRWFFVTAAGQYPDIIKKLWPQVTRWAHSDQTRHTDGHRDSVHNDSIGNPRQGYRPGQHIDYKDYSDCSHSDHQNSNIHTDDAGEGFLKEFPPAIRE